MPQARDEIDFTPNLGICQWFHFEDHRLEAGVRWLQEIGVKQDTAERPVRAL